MANCYDHQKPPLSVGLSPSGRFCFFLHPLKVPDGFQSIFFFFFFSGGKWRDLAMVNKNHHYICSWPLFRPHDSPVRGIKVTEPDLNSPWELPRWGSYSTPALESPVGFLLN